MEVLAHGPMRPGGLAETMSLSPSTLTRNLKTLIATGWLDLGPGNDGRTRSVRITPSGRKKCVEGVPHWTTAQAKVHQLIGRRNVGALHALVEDCVATRTSFHCLRRLRPTVQTVHGFRATARTLLAEVLEVGIHDGFQAATEEFGRGCPALGKNAAFASHSCSTRRQSAHASRAPP